MAIVSKIPPLTDHERMRLMAEVRRLGETRASVELGISRHTITRALGGLPLRAGTTLLIRTSLQTSQAG